jgi:SAM-dependent methyltransferase
MNTVTPWDIHYKREKSMLGYPDENLVRMLKPIVDGKDTLSDVSLLDCGCGSGRHMKLAKDVGIETVIGIDLSFNAVLPVYNSGLPVLCCNMDALPFKKESFDIVVCWGSLHYGPKSKLHNYIDEIKRIMKPGGSILGTLRSDRDTMMKNGKYIGNNEWITDLKDILHSHVSFFSEDELKTIFSGFDFKYGIIERSPLGERSSIISHWYYRAIL